MGKYTGMNIATYFRKLSDSDKKTFAAKAGTTVGYLSAHVLGLKVRKKPKDELIIRLVAAANGNVTLDEAIDYFLVQPVKSLAAEHEVRPAMDEAEVKGFDKDNKAHVMEAGL